MVAAKQNKTKKFHLGDVLSITTSWLVSPRGMDGVYDILDFMVGESLFTHQLPRASDICKPALLEQYPQLNNINTSKVNRKNYKRWLARQVAKYGRELSVKPLAKDKYEVKDPITEAGEGMIGKGAGAILVVID